MVKAENIANYGLRKISAWANETNSELMSKFISHAQDKKKAKRTEKY
jgi:hypothetical protein